MAFARSGRDTIGASMANVIGYGVLLCLGRSCALHSLSLDSKTLTIPVNRRAEHGAAHYWGTATLRISSADVIWPEMELFGHEHLGCDRSSRLYVARQRVPCALAKPGRACL